MSTTPTAFADAVQSLATELLNAVSDPADAVRIMTALADFSPSLTSTASVQGNAVASAQSAVGDLCRRAAVVALARAAANYQPSSYDDANTLRMLVCSLLDKEITTSGDQGQDATYSSLRTLRAAVNADLKARGGTLTPMKTFTFRNTQPADVLATRLYRDPSRADQLVAQANPVHPAFMPTSFQALAE